MTRTDIAKKAVSITVGAGVAKIVGGIVRHNTDPETAIDTVAIASAQVVTGMMIAEMTEYYTNDKIDKLVSWWEKNVH
jgi:ABC-type cobalamin transport system permease subunit